jgi:CheY-like chemotaxis protein
MFDPTMWTVIDPSRWTEPARSRLRVVLAYAAFRRLEVRPVLDPRAIVVGLVECPTLRMYQQFLVRRGYTVRPIPATDAAVLVLCSDHASDPTLRSAGAAFIGPKLLLGFDPPAGWVKAQRLKTPLLPLDLERLVLELCAGSREAATSYSVLVVEDDATTAATVARAFQDGGLRVQSCGGFAEMAKALQSRPDFILMDLNLPGLSGEKLGEIIRLKHIPVAVFSSEPLARIEAARLRIGGVAAFPKETPLRNVADWIRKYLDGRKPR